MRAFFCPSHFRVAIHKIFSRRRRDRRDIGWQYHSLFSSANSAPPRLCENLTWENLIGGIGPGAVIATEDEDIRWSMREETHADDASKLVDGGFECHSVVDFETVNV